MSSKSRKVTNDSYGTKLDAVQSADKVHWSIGLLAGCEYQSRSERPKSNVQEYIDTVNRRRLNVFRRFTSPCITSERRMGTGNKLSMGLSVSVTRGRSGAWKECLTGTGWELDHVTGSLRSRRGVGTVDSDPHEVRNPPTDDQHVHGAPRL